MTGNKKRIKLLLAHLTSGDVDRLERGIEASKKMFTTKDMNIVIDYDIHIVVNTKNPDYFSQVKNRLGSQVPVIIETESDGTPGTGKNSVFDHFRRYKGKYDYLFQVDGDDFLYPCALRQLSRLLEKTDMADVVSFQSMDWLSTNFTDQMSYVPIIDKKLWLYSWCHQEPNLREIPAFIYVTEPEFGKSGRIFTPGTSMILSKKFLMNHSDVRHTNEISLFEDYLYYLKLFKLHLDKKIKMIHTNNSFFYVYDKANENSISTKNCYYTEKEINILRGFAEENNMMEFHPKNDMEFITLGVPDEFALEDKVVFVKRMFGKYKVKMQSLVLPKPGEQKKDMYNIGNFSIPPLPTVNTNPNIVGPRVVGNFR